MKEKWNVFRVIKLVKPFFPLHTQTLSCSSVVVHDCVSTCPTIAGWVSTWVNTVAAENIWFVEADCVFTTVDRICDSCPWTVIALNSNDQSPHQTPAKKAKKCICQTFKYSLKARIFIIGTFAALVAHSYMRMILEEEDFYFSKMKTFFLTFRALMIASHQQLLHWLAFLWTKTHSEHQLEFSIWPCLTPV